MTNLLEGLTPNQAKAVTHRDGPCLVVAGAGTGKTMVITRRIAYLVKNEQIPPDQIAALTFTDKAAREMEERLDLLLPYGMTGTTIATFHSFCADIFRRHAFLLGLDPASKLMSSAEEVSFLRQHLEELPIALFKPSKNPIEFLRQFVGYLGKLKDEYIEPDKLKQYAHNLKENAGSESESETAELYKELANLYQATLKLYADNSVISYADLIFYSLKLLEKFPSVQAAEQERWRYILVDEFQDTNFSQAEVARILAGNHRNLMVVGDDDQAIYSFRGANLTNILNFRQLFPEALTLSLSDNFRSSQPILDLAYTLIQQNNPDRLEIKEKVCKQLKASSPQGSPPEHWHFERSSFEYQAIAQNIKEKLANKEYNPEDIAVLARAKSHLQGVENALKALDIPYELYGNSQFYNQEIIQVVLAYLRSICSPHDDMVLFFCLSQAPFSVKTSLLQRFLKEARYLNSSLWDYLENNLLPANPHPHETAAAETVTDPSLKESWQYLKPKLSFAKAKPTEALLDFLHTSGWYDQIRAEGINEKIEQLATLYQEMQGFEESNPGSSLNHYVRHLDYLLATEEDLTLAASQPNLQGVQLMTVHRSKGLEFPVVFMTNLAEGRFPSRNRSESLPFPYELTNSILPEKETHLQEERRLAYVAITRAKEKLYLTSSRFYNDNLRPVKPSRFVMEAFQYLDEPAAQNNHRQSLLEKESAYSQPNQLTKIAKQSKQLVLPKSYSPSSLDDYEQCPQRYLFAHVWQIKVPANQQINFGISIHKTLQEWYSAASGGEEPDLEKIYRKAWQSGGYASKKLEEDQFNFGLLKLKEYLAGPNGKANPLALERNIKAKLPSGKLLSGKIDRLDPAGDGGVKLIDYKSGENIMKPSQMLVDIPLGSYLLATEQNKEKVVEVELQYVMIGKTLTAQAGSLDLPKIIERAESLIKEIDQSLLSNDFPAKPSYQNCAFCDYHDICPYRYQKS